MTSGILTLATFVSVFLFPWPLSVALALLSAIFEPLVPLAAGLFADALYYTPGAAHVPYATLVGALATFLAYVVRSRLSASIMD